jgi:hypothetical protein
LPPLGPTKSPRNLHDFLEWLKHPSGVASGS